MLLSRLIEAIEQIAPPHRAEAWDNVGLLCGDPEQAVSKVLLTIDFTHAVAAESTALGCEAVVAYHPPIFHAVKKILAGSVVFDAIRQGVAIYSPHTALDVAEGGTNDVLCEVMGLKDCSPLKVAESRANQLKLVTFAPEAAVDRICKALFNAGAGRIGDYSSCSFRSPGTGTFFGEAGTNPAVGQSGKLELAPEIRIEVVLPIARTADVVQALRQSHPYEEPAFDLYPLAPLPETRGMGRIGSFPQPTEVDELLNRLKQGLGVNHLLVAGPQKGTIATAAVCAGACGGEFLDIAIARKANLYVTGEMRHHDALKAAEAGLTVVCTLHSNSERVTLGRLKDRLLAALPDLQIYLSQADRDPFNIL